MLSGTDTGSDLCLYLGSHSWYRDGSPSLGQVCGVPPLFRPLCPTPLLTSCSPGHSGRRTSRTWSRISRDGTPMGPVVSSRIVTSGATGSPSGPRPTSNPGASSGPGISTHRVSTTDNHCPEPWLSRCVSIRGEGQGCRRDGVGDQPSYSHVVDQTPISARGTTTGETVISVGIRPTSAPSSSVTVTTRDRGASPTPPLRGSATW